MSLANSTCDRCGKFAPRLSCTIEDWDKVEPGWIKVGLPPPSVPVYCEDCRELVPDAE